jgi:hypothetical protein
MNSLKTEIVKLNTEYGITDKYEIFHKLLDSGFKINIYYLNIVLLELNINGDIGNIPDY